MSTNLYSSRGQGANGPKRYYFQHTSLESARYFSLNFFWSEYKALLLAFERAHCLTACIRSVRTGSLRTCGVCTHSYRLCFISTQSYKKNNQFNKCALICRVSPNRSSFTEILYTQSQIESTGTCYN